MNLSKFSMFLQKKKIKKIILIIGILFYVLTTFIVLKPKPFLEFGYFGVFVFNLFGPGTFLVPILSRYMDIFLVSFVSSLGMAFNDSVSWIMGKSSDIVFPRTKKVESLEKSVRKYGVWALFFWALIPFPFDFVAVIAGYLEIPYNQFFFPVFLARMIRFILLGSGTIAVFGKM